MLSFFSKNAFWRRLSKIMSRKDKFILLGLLFLSIFVAFVETLGISLIMPFISVATNFGIIGKHFYINWLYEFLGSESPRAFVVNLGVILLLFYLFRTILTIFFTYALNKFSAIKYGDVAKIFFRNYMEFDYKKYTSKNSATVYKIIFSDSNAINLILLSTLSLVSELFTFFLIYLMLLWTSLKITIVITLLFCLKVLFIIKPFFSRIEAEGKKAGYYSWSMVKTFYETFNNFKLIKFLSNEQYLFNKFAESNDGYIKTSVFNVTLQAVPRSLLELLGFCILIGTVMYVVLFAGTPELLMPMVSMYAVAFYRFLPSVNKILDNYNKIIFSSGSLEDDYYNLLDVTEKELVKNVVFKERIEFQNISFSHDMKKPLLENINLVINKGQKVGFIGESGVGKSTLIDILTGIYKPKLGEIVVDGCSLTTSMLRTWREKIGYVPQDTYLFDGNVADNVIFGRDYNLDQLIKVLKRANIYDFLLIKDGVETKVGEGGIKLSGGQKQRISIARALYSNPEILILDEATSSLDTAVEAKIMKEVYDNSLDFTLIIVTHRLSTIYGCDIVYEIKNGDLHKLINHYKVNEQSLVKDFN
ncbi:ABC transporter ATP-binding protein [Candidatus Babeliales bacterium]|nr:ABC transporter ATP-binding protein [Candidatus Babeliales bacterium]